MGYPDFQMGEFDESTHSYYDEIGLSMNIVKSDVSDKFIKMGLPLHLYCADTLENVELCVQKGTLSPTKKGGNEINRFCL